MCLSFSFSLSPILSLMHLLSHSFAVYLHVRSLLHIYTPIHSLSLQQVHKAIWVYPSLLFSLSLSLSLACFFSCSLNFFLSRSLSHSLALSCSLLLSLTLCCSLSLSLALSRVPSLFFQPALCFFLKFYNVNERCDTCGWVISHVV